MTPRSVLHKTFWSFMTTVLITIAHVRVSGSSVSSTMTSVPYLATQTILYNTSRNATKEEADADPRNNSNATVPSTCTINSQMNGYVRWPTLSVKIVSMIVALLGLMVVLVSCTCAFFVGYAMGKRKTCGPQIRNTETVESGNDVEESQEEGLMMILPSHLTEISRWRSNHQPADRTSSLATVPKDDPRQAKPPSQPTANPTVIQRTNKRGKHIQSANDDLSGPMKTSANMKLAQVLYHTLETKKATCQVKDDYRARIIDEPGTSSVTYCSIGVEEDRSHVAFLDNLFDSADYQLLNPIKCLGKESKNNTNPNKP